MLVYYECFSSYSRNEWLPDGFGHEELHDINILIEHGAKKQKLRAHSDFYPNAKVNDWALSFWDDFDIQCESKAKNLASEQLYEQAKSRIHNSTKNKTTLLPSAYTV